LERVNRELATVEGKNLTPEQKEIAERIRTFRKQAEQAREQDLLTAVSLARRADLLAKDLLEHLP
jgi:isocitrate lyase